jgi:hypothetical protein
MAVKNVGDFQTPTGAKGNLFNLKDMWGLILGGFVLLFTFATAQNLARKASDRFPMLDTSVENPIATAVRSNGVVKERY